MRLTLCRFWTGNTYLEFIVVFLRNYRAYFRWRVGGLPGGWRVRLEFARREARA